MYGRHQKALMTYGEPMRVLGISAFYHDSAAALIIDGKIISAAQEERFTRIKHDEAFPINAIQYCLKNARLQWQDLDAVVFYDKPWLKFERIIETYHAVAPRGLASFRHGLPIWIKEKILLPRLLRKHIPKSIPLKFSSHHLSHAASAYYPSPYKTAAVLTLDGVGEWATCTIAHGKDSELTILKEMNFPHSIGLLYSAFTQYCGFKVNSGEYKLMGLAPYGRKGHQQVQFFKEQITSKMIHIYQDGGIWLDQHYFSYTTDLSMVNESSWTKLLGLPCRHTDAPLTQAYCDLALAIQQVLEEIVLALAATAKNITGETNLCLAGGVALNCVANSALLQAGLFTSIWIQPAAGDAGGALGAALAYYNSMNEAPRSIQKHDQMSGAYLGPSYTPDEIQDFLRKHNVNFSKNESITKKVAKLLEQGQVVGWFQGKMEFGPRALGNRSILADPRSPEMQKKLNLKIKYRESFRPFAPSILKEDCAELFVHGTHSPYMLFIDQLKPQFCNKLPADYDDKTLEEKLYFVRSVLPAVTHLDYSARLQTVEEQDNPLYYELLTEFKSLTGYGVIVNTSFNVRGEPIVESPIDAFNCFINTEMDALALGPYLVMKEDQSPEVIDHFKKLKLEFQLD